jgi:hypothetical protein
MTQTGIFRGRADKNDRAIFNAMQQRILLHIEPMNRR